MIKINTISNNVAWKKYLGPFSDVGEQVYGQPGETGKFFYIYLFLL